MVNTPPDQTKSPGESATFSVSATTGLTYQWRKNGNDISGANGSSYMISSVTTADADSYDVAGTGTCGPAVTSTAATLTVGQQLPPDPATVAPPLDPTLPRTMATAVGAVDHAAVSSQRPVRAVVDRPSDYRGDSGDSDPQWRPSAGFLGDQAALVATGE
jgi:hypothetical protein